MGSTMSAIDVKLTAQCLASLRDLGRATISDLADSTGLSRPTVTAALTSLMASNWPRYSKRRRLAMDMRCGLGHVRGLTWRPHPS